MQDVREMCPYWNKEREARNDRRCECTGPMRCYPMIGAVENAYKGRVPENRELQPTPRQNIW